MSLRIGTRGSRLALIQAEKVRSVLLSRRAGLQAQIVTIQTQGDRVLDSPLSRIGGKGLFIREIEDALLAGRIDLAVHSLKDLPTALPEGLALAGALSREDPRDAFVSRDGRTPAGMRDGERVGTSSLRRAAQLLQLNPRLRIVDMRGNVDTRLRKLAEGECAALVLAACGLDRLGLGGRITERLDPGQMLPAVCQGIIGIEIRRQDRRSAELLDSVSDPGSLRMAAGERAFLRRLEGGCQVPVGCLSALDGSECRVEGLVATLDGRRVIRRSVAGPVERIEGLAEELAETILAEGGEEILEQIRNSLGE